MSYFFVGGSQRSGTTILQKFICMDSSTNPKFAEASYLRFLMQAYQKGLNDFEHDTREYFSDKQEFSDFHGNVVDQFLVRTKAHFPGAEHLVLKDPHLTNFFPELFKLLSDAKFILSIRNPKDIIASMIQVGQRMADRGEYIFFQDRDMSVLCDYVNFFYNPSLNCTDSNFQKNLLVLRYEDFVLDTAKIKQQVASFTQLSMDFDESETNKEVVDAIKGHQPRYEPWVTENSSKTINNSSIGKYADVLTEEEILQIEKYCANLLQRFEYQSIAA